MFLDLAEDEVEFPVLFSLLVRVEGTGLGEVGQEGVVLTSNEVTALRLGVHPFSLNIVTFYIHVA